MVPWLISLLLRCPYSLLSCTSRWSCYFAQLPVNTTTTRIWSGQAVLPFLHVAVFAVKTASNFWSWFWAQDVWLTLSCLSTKLVPSFFFLGPFCFLGSMFLSSHRATPSENIGNGLLGSATCGMQEEICTSFLIVEQDRHLWLLGGTLGGCLRDFHPAVVQSHIIKWGSEKLYII